jgi:2-keto-4-pentenoate hydratase
MTALAADLAARAQQHADALFAAFERGEPVAPPTAGDAALDADGAYAVQRALVDRHRAAGRRVVGRKIGLTSLAMQRQLGVPEPDYGVLLDSHAWASGACLGRAAERMIAPRLEAELAFVLDRALAGPGVTAGEVLAATRAVVPVWELIDSRVRDWQITLADTIADNASSLGVVVGDRATAPSGVDLRTVGLVLERDGEVVATGAGAAVLGHPARAVAWLANALGRHGEQLPAGQLVLSGSFTAAVDAQPGSYRASFGGGLGAVEVRVDA